MHQQGILKTDDLITRFFRLCTEMCVEISYRAQAEQQHNPAASAAIIRAKCYHNLDAFVRLIALLVKHSGEASNTVTKINLLNKVQQYENADGVLWLSFFVGHSTLQYTSSTSPRQEI